LLNLEGDSILVQLLNKKGIVTKEEKGVVKNLRSDIMRRGGLHTVLMLGEEKKNGKVARTQYSTMDPSIRLYKLNCEE